MLKLRRRSVRVENSLSCFGNPRCHQHDKAIRLENRQRSQEHRVDDRKNCRRCANPKCQRDDGRYDKRGALKKHVNRIVHVFEESVHRCTSVLLTKDRPHSFHPLATQKGAEISRCMDDSKNLYSAWMWMIKDERFLEAGYPEDS